jgi:peptidoglycan-associated lipoprotein
MGVTVRAFTILLLGTLVACASTSGQQTQSDGGFKPEATSSDPGLSGREGMQSGVERSATELRTIYFEFDAYSLQSDARNRLEQNAQYMREHPQARIEVQGNCDDRGSTEYNLALGQRRAEAARRYLVNLGIDAGRIDTISFGEENPAVRGHSETAWAKNRRDDFVLR